MATVKRNSCLLTGWNLKQTPTQLVDPFQPVHYHAGSIRDGSVSWCLNLLVGDVITVVLIELPPQLVHTSMWHILACFGLCLQTLRSWIWWRTSWEFCNSYQVSLPKSERTGAEWQHTGICSILCVFWWTRQPGEAQVNISYQWWKKGFALDLSMSYFQAERMYLF